MAAGKSFILMGVSSTGKTSVGTETICIRVPMSSKWAKVIH